MIWTLPPPPGRRGSLDRAAVVRAAIAVADEGGADSLTMAAVARRLGPYTPMALYRYVGSRDGLIDLMLDAAAGEVPVPPVGADDWRHHLREMAINTRAMVHRHLWFAELFHSRPPLGPNLLRRTEFVLSVLETQDASLEQGMTYAAMLDRYVLGDGLQEAEEARMRRRHGLEEPATFLASVAASRPLAEAAGYRHLATWLRSPTAPAPDEVFDLGLDWLLEGIADALRDGGQ